MKTTKRKITLIILSFLTLSTFAQNGRYSNVVEAIQNADKVTELWVYDDDGSIPVTISKCKNIKSIRFTDLSAMFDIQKALTNISTLPELKTVEFWGLNATEPPSNLTKLHQVEHIEFYRSPSIKLDQYIAKLKSLPNLEMLTLRWMSLTSIPSEIVQLKKLKYLNLDNNPQLDLSQTFNSLAKLKIEELNLSSARFNSVPSDIAQLKYLKSLTLEMVQGNFNNKETYASLSKLKKLRHLNVQGNFFEAFHPSIAILKKLKKIEVDGNCLDPEAFKKLKEFLPKTEIQNEIPC